MAGTNSAIGGIIQEANVQGWNLLPTIYSAGMPRGIVTEAAYQTMLQELLDRLAMAKPIDGLLVLHLVLFPSSKR